MATFADSLQRGDTSALMPEEFSDAILDKLQYSSGAMGRFKRINMGRKQVRLPILAGLASAYFVNGNTGSDSGLIPTTKTKWDNKYLNAEEIAVIMPIPKAVLDDVDMDVWSDMQDKCEQAIAVCLDQAVFFGVNKPQSWGPSILYGINNAEVDVNGTNGNPKYTVGTSAANIGGLAQDFNVVQGFIESSGFLPDMVAADPQFKQKLRAMRDTLGQRLLDVQVQDGKYSINGIDIQFCMPGQWPTGSGTPRMFIGDKSEGMLGYRQDIEAEILDQAVIQDASGRIVFNLAQQNMVALKLVCRFAWEVANTINWQQPSEALRFPFAALTS